MLNEVVEVLKKIESYHFEAYVVGGFVRDFYRNIENSDIDICTSAKPEELKKIFGDNITSNQYGSLILEFKCKKYEITTFRKEGRYQDNRHPKIIKYVKKLKMDLKRRDFTMNAICLTSDLNYIDYFHGRDDINNKLIRMIGKPEKRLKEDCLRILRAVRFATVLDFELEENLKNGIKTTGFLLNNLSYFYKKRELEKIFLCSNFKKGVSLILELGLDKPLELKNLDKLVFTSSLVGIWAQLGVVDVYPFSNAEKYIIDSVNKLDEKDLFDPHILYNNQWTVLKTSAEIRKIDVKRLEDAYNNLPIHSQKDIKISYNEISDFIINSQPQEILKDIEHLILSKRLRNEHNELLNYIKEKYN